MEIVFAVLKAIAAFPAIKKAIEQGFSLYLAWLDRREYDRIVASARSLRNAKTVEDKRKALDEWVNATK